jgi:hypothetical protein
VRIGASAAEHVSCKICSTPPGAAAGPRCTAPTQPRRAHTREGANAPPQLPRRGASRRHEDATRDARVGRGCGRRRRRALCSRRQLHKHTCFGRERQRGCWRALSLARRAAAAQLVRRLHGRKRAHAVCLVLLLFAMPSMRRGVPRLHQCTSLLPELVATVRGVPAPCALRRRRAPAAQRAQAQRAAARSAGDAPLRRCRKDSEPRPQARARCGAALGPAGVPARAAPLRACASSDVQQCSLRHRFRFSASRTR